MALALAACLLGPASALAGEVGGISGVVKGPKAEPLNNLAVCATPVGGGSTACLYTNSEGEYAIGGLAPGLYTVYFGNEGCGEGPCITQNYLQQYWNDKPTQAEAEDVVVSANTTHENIDATLEAGGEIRGTVTGAPSKTDLAVQVCASPTSEESYYYEKCADANSNGEYAIVGLATGEYRVYFSNRECSEGGGCTILNYAPQYWDDEPGYFNATPVPVTAGSARSGVNAELAVGGSIEGTVTAAAGNTPIESIEVCAIDTEGERACARTNGTGHYELMGLAEGDYKVEFKGGEICGEPCQQLNFVAQYYEGSSTEMGAKPVHVTSGLKTGPIDAVMAAGAEITGTVTAAPSGSPVAGVYVCARPTEAGKEVDCEGTDSKGNYTIAGLQGSYRIEFEEQHPYISQFYNDVFSEHAATILSLTAPETRTGINARLVESEAQALREASELRAKAAEAARKQAEEVKRQEEAAAAKRHEEAIEAEERSASVKVEKTKVSATAVTLTLKLTIGGSVTITGPGLKKTTISLSAGTHVVKVSLTAAGKSERKHHKKIKLTVGERVDSRSLSASEKVKL